MVRLTGEVLRTRTLSTVGGKTLTVEILRLANTLPNKQALADASRFWQKQALELAKNYPEGRRHPTPRRGLFAADVAFLASYNLGKTAQAPSGTDYRILAAQETGSGDLLGLILYTFDKASGRWHLDLQATRPLNQPGWPAGAQVRGIGNELTGAAVADMNSTVCAPVELDCLDARACDHWAHLGFKGDVRTHGPLRLTCPESQALAARLAHTEADDPGAGEHVEAGSVADRYVPLSRR